MTQICNHRQGTSTHSYRNSLPERTDQRLASASDASSRACDLNSVARRLPDRVFNVVLSVRPPLPQIDFGHVHAD